MFKAINYYIRKISSLVVHPAKWKKAGRQVILLLSYFIRHGTSFFNINTKEYWNKRLSAMGNFWRDEHYYHLFNLLPENGRFSLLDIGCGIGDGCELIQSRFPGAEITGLDISNVGIEKAKTKTVKVKYMVVDILKDPLPGTYDYITIIETLEHFDDPFFVIDKCLQHARVAVIVSVPYTPQYSGKVLAVSEHRYCFNENTFSKYSFRIAQITDYIKSTDERCIIYEIYPNRPK